MGLSGRVDPGMPVDLTEKQRINLSFRLEFLIDDVYLKGNGINKEYFKGYVSGLCDVGILSDEEFDQWIKKMNKAGGLRE